jgi:hypothetical protein
MYTNGVPMVGFLLSFIFSEELVLKTHGKESVVQSSPNSISGPEMDGH